MNNLWTGAYFSDTCSCQKKEEGGRSNFDLVFSINCPKSHGTFNKSKKSDILIGFTFIKVTSLIQ
jgi:hypothetical protein